jgi:hypothetical protein
VLAVPRSFSLSLPVPRWIPSRQIEFWNNSHETGVHGSKHPSLCRLCGALRRNNQLHPVWATPIFDGPKPGKGAKVGKDKKRKKTASPAPLRSQIQKEYVSQLSMARGIADTWQDSPFNYEQDGVEYQHGIRIVGVEVVPAKVRTLVLKHTILRNLILRFLDLRFLVSHFTFCVGRGQVPWQLQVDRAHRRQRVAPGYKRTDHGPRAGERLRRQPRGVSLPSHVEHEAAPQEALGACGCRVDAARGAAPRRTHHVGAHSSEAVRRRHAEQLPGHAWRGRQQEPATDQASMQIL